MKQRNFFRHATISLLHIWLGLLVLIPLFIMLVTSFLVHTDQKLISFHLTWGNYSQLLNTLYLRILWQSIKLAFFCTVICLLIGYPTAFIINNISQRYKPLLLILVIIPFWTSSLIRTYAMLAILKTKGILNSVLLTLHLIHHPLHILYSNTAVLIGCIYNLLPFMILPLYANIDKLDGQLFEAGRDLGANRYQLFTRVIFPLTLPGILAGSLLVFLPAMTLFYIPNLLGGAKSLLLGNLIQNQFLTLRDWPGGAATSMVLTFMMLILLLIYRRVTRHKQQDLLT